MLTKALSALVAILIFALYMVLDTIIEHFASEMAWLAYNLRLNANVFTDEQKEAFNEFNDELDPIFIALDFEQFLPENFEGALDYEHDIGYANCLRNFAFILYNKGKIWRLLEKVIVKRAKEIYREISK